MNEIDPLTRIQADAVTALKAGEKDRVRVLRTIASDLKKAAIDGGVDAVKGDAAYAVLRRAVKSRTDAADQYAKAGRADAATAEKAEIAIIESYLPRAPTEVEIRAIVQEIVGERGLSGAAAMGVVMKEAMTRLGAGADGKLVSRIVADVLKTR
jgi:uncharacterized protein YqeY